MLDNLNDIINNIHKKTWFNIKMIEKDYYITLFFKELEKIDHNLVFKWGTCLNKIYFWFYRLSEDIDFSIYDNSLVNINKLSRSKQKDERKKIMDDVKHILDKCFFSIWCIEYKEFDKSWEYRYKFNENKMMRLFYQYNSISWEKNIIQVEISWRQNSILQPQIETLQHLYILRKKSLISWWDINVKCYNINEVIAEKIRCSYWRMWKWSNWEVITKIAIRDHFDILFSLSKIEQLYNFWFLWFNNDKFLEILLSKNIWDYQDWHISKDLLFEEEYNFVKNNIILNSNDLQIVLNKDIWFFNELDKVLYFIKEVQLSLKEYINKKYNINISINEHIDYFLKYIITL